MQNTEIYQALMEHMARQTEFQNSISRDMGRLGEKLDAVHAETKKTNGRVTSLERFRWQISGGVVVACALSEWVKAKFFGS